LKIRSIAVNTFRETIRDRILYSLLAFAIIMIGLSYFLAGLSLGDFDRIIINFGLACVHIFGAVIAIFIGITLVNKEVEKRTIYSIVSKPVSRFKFLVGKFSGLAITLLVTTVAMVSGLVITLFLQSGAFHLDLFTVAIFIYLELLLLTAIAILFSSFSSPTLSSIITLFLFFIGHLSPSLKYFGERADSGMMKPILLFLYYTLPNLENFNLKNMAVYGVSVDFHHVLFVGAYFCVYVIVVLLIARTIFSRRDFK
jgi:ABC-type transport system involved in multi-copper enzyme maturation permease subunit